MTCGYLECYSSSRRSETEFNWKLLPKPKQFGKRLPAQPRDRVTKRFDLSAHSIFLGYLDRVSPRISQFVRRTRANRAKSVLCPRVRLSIPTLRDRPDAIFEFRDYGGEPRPPTRGRRFHTRRRRSFSKLTAERERLLCSNQNARQRSQGCWLLRIVPAKRNRRLFHPTAQSARNRMLVGQSCAPDWRPLIAASTSSGL